MTKVNMQEAKTRLSQLVAAAEKGETIFLCRDGHPVVELRPLAKDIDRKLADTSDLGPPIGHEEALAPLDDGDWGGWIG